MSLRVIFMGTPEFAVPSLQALLNDTNITVLGVMTQPDRPSGRGQKLTPPPVKILAESKGLEVRQPTRLRKEPEMLAWIKEKSPDFIVTAAFGQILPQELLDMPKYGTVNVHASLLPRYRGANPVQWAILNGDSETGITTMMTVLAVDAGPMLLQAKTNIDPDETTQQLVLRLAELGATILPNSLHQLAAGIIVPVEQNVERATHAPKLTKEDSVLDWNQPATTIHNKIRAQIPWPGTLTCFQDQDIKIIQSQSPVTASEAPSPGTTPGEIITVDKAGIWVQTQTTPLLITMIQPPGKPKISARDWANGTLKQSSTSYCFTPPISKVL